MLQLDHRPPKEPHEVHVDQSTAQSNPNPNPKHLYQDRGSKSRPFRERASKPSMSSPEGCSLPSRLSPKLLRRLIASPLASSSEGLDHARGLETRGPGRFTLVAIATDITSLQLNIDRTHRLASLRVARFARIFLSLLLKRLQYPTSSLLYLQQATRSRGAFATPL